MYVLIMVASEKPKITVDHKEGDCQTLELSSTCLPAHEASFKTFIGKQVEQLVEETIVYEAQKEVTK